MPRRNREIWYSLVAVLGVTGLYFAAYWRGGAAPAASSIMGHWIGVAGFVLMLTTEVAYSIRKQLTDARWGPIAGWLQFHIVTGLVGPYMVLLHTAMHFHGLAGVATLLTLVVVASGVVGRYLYTAVPRTVDVDSADANSPLAEGRARQLSSQRHALATWRTLHVPLTWVLFATAFIHSAAAMWYVTLQR